MGGGECLWAWETENLRESTHQIPLDPNINQSYRCIGYRRAKSAVLPTGYGKSLIYCELRWSGYVTPYILLIGHSVIQLRAVIFSNACLVPPLQLGHFHYSLPDPTAFYMWVWISRLLGKCNMHETVIHAPFVMMNNFLSLTHMVRSLRVNAMAITRPNTHTLTALVPEVVEAANSAHMYQVTIWCEIKA